MRKHVLLLLSLLSISFLPGNKADHAAKIRLLLSEGKVRDAILFTDSCLKNGTDQEFYLGWKLVLLKIGNQTDQAMECATRLEEITGGKQVTPAYNLAELHLKAGNISRTLYWMSQAASRGLKDLRLFGGEEWDTVKKEPGYQPVLQRILENRGIGKPTPEFSVKLAGGKEITLKDLRGKVVLIDFWATWCSPCLQTIPGLKEYYRQYHPQGFEILAVSLDRDIQALTKYLGREKISWLVSYSGQEWGSDETAKLYGVDMIPATFLLDKQGRLRYYNLKSDELETALRVLLEE